MSVENRSPYPLLKYSLIRHPSGGRLCTLIGVPCRFSMLSTFSTSANVLFQDKSPRAEGAKTDPPPGYIYEGTQTTAWQVLPYKASRPWWNWLACCKEWPDELAAINFCWLFTGLRAGSGQTGFLQKGHKLHTCCNLLL